MAWDNKPMILNQFGQLVPQGFNKTADAYAVIEAENGAMKVSPPQTQALVTATLDFKGKTAGQTFDVPHAARSKTTAVFDTPASFVAEHTTNGYAAISTVDGTCLIPTISVNTQYAQTLLAFDLLNALKLARLIPLSWTRDDLVSRLKFITLAWTGFGSGANGGVATNGATVKVWSSGAWVQWGANTANTPAIITNGTNNGFANHLDANGVFFALAHTTYPSDGVIASTINTDYISVTVQFYGDYLLTPDVETMGRTGSPAPTKAAMVGGKTPTGTIEAVSLDANRNQKVALTNSAGNPVENTEGLLLASAARTATPAASPVTNRHATGVVVYLNITANPGGAETLTINLFLRDGTAAVRGPAYASFVIPAATNGLFALVVSPGATGAPATAASYKVFGLPLPISYDVQVAHSGAGAWTYQLDKADTL